MLAYLLVLGLIVIALMLTGVAGYTGYQVYLLLNRPAHDPRNTPALAMFGAICCISIYHVGSIVYTIANLNWIQ